MVVFNIAKLNEFDETVGSSNLVVVHFYADWADQCGPMNDVLEELAKQSELKSVKFAKCVAEDLPEVSLKYQISAVPTFLILRDGALLDRVNGANAAELTQKINQLISKGDYEKPSAQPEKELPSRQDLQSRQDLHNRLTELINSAPVMLFMKGNPRDPKCGFSRTMVNILNNYNADFQTFDILHDEEVRQGLKEFSNWPTYPQLYLNGELIGGLDIVREMDENGELINLLPRRVTLDDRLQALINKAPCMIFMKGSRDLPRCGFSRKLMEIMKETQIPFETFDILTNEDIRQGLKTLSNWPTYPQVYVKGELIGGLDIINELKENGELLDTLNGTM